MAKRKYVLHPSQKVAVPLPQVGVVPPEPPVPPAATPPAATPPAPPVPPLAGVEVRPGRVIVRKGDGAGGPDVHIEVIRVGSDGSPSAPTPPMPPMPPLMLHGNTLPLPYGMQGKGVTESLGSRDFDGVRAEGTRTTHTIAAGVIGNEKPIALVSERWYSPELHLVVMSSNSDPRSGITVYRLANIKRGEPAVDLFKVPADYKTPGGATAGYPQGAVRPFTRIAYVMT